MPCRDCAGNPVAFREAGPGFARASFAAKRRLLRIRAEARDLIIRAQPADLATACSVG